MEINSESNINAATARHLRKETGLLQREFWGAIGVSQPSGGAYERGRSPIPKPVRILLMARYVVGLELDATTERGVAEVRRLAVLQKMPRAEVKKALGLIGRGVAMLETPDA